MYKCMLHVAVKLVYFDKSQTFGLNDTLVINQDRFFLVQCYSFKELSNQSYTEGHSSFQFFFLHTLLFIR